MTMASTAEKVEIWLCAPLSTKKWSLEMALKSYRPTSPGRRFMTTADFSELTKKEPEKSLVRPIKKTGGRNNSGRITTRFRGGGAKRAYRIIDFKRNKDDMAATVIAIE